MKKNLILFVLAVLVIGGYLIYSGLGTNIVEKPSLTIELPKKFHEDSENIYIFDDKMMFVEFDYYPNELDFDAETMLYTVLYNEFYEDDIFSVDETTINGEDVWQAEYRTLTTGNDGIHYYYSGIMTAFTLDNEILIVDAYNAMEESVGINSTISDADLQMLEDIVNSVVITDKSYKNVETNEERMELNDLTLVLSNNWEETVEGENGEYDFGYYASYLFANLPIRVDMDEYNDENRNDIESLSAAPEGYTALGTKTINGEEAYLYSYDAYSSDGLEPYYYGVVAVSEHYYIDVYFRIYEVNYKLTDDIVDAFLELISNVE